MENDLITFTRQDGIGILTLNDPEKRNALSTPMIDLLVEQLQAANTDMELRCLILTGSGRAFCAGGDIKMMQERTGYAAGSPVEIRRSMITEFQRIPKALFELEVPIIAAVNGAAIGAGCDIAAMCDICIAGESASFAESFIQLGLLSGDGGAWFLIRAIGYQRAAQMTLTGDRIDAHTAHDWGLAAQVVPDAELLESALKLAKRIAKNPPQSLRLARRLLRESSQTNMHSALEYAALMQGIAFHTEDHREAVNAAMEKRSATYRGA